MMSISSISSATDVFRTYQTSGQNKLKEIRQDFKDLGSALQAGDLQDAQKAFAALQQLLPNSSAGNLTQNGQQTSAGNPFATDLSGVGEALQSGDLKKAQDAFAKLQQDMQAVRGPHRHRHHHKVSSSNQGVGQNTVATDFQTLGQALQSGDLSGAQKAFTQLQQDAQKYNPSGQVTAEAGVGSSVNITT
jgi:ribosomal protein S20